MVGDVAPEVVGPLVAGPEAIAVVQSPPEAIVGPEVAADSVVSVAESKIFAQVTVVTLVATIPAEMDVGPEDLSRYMEPLVLEPEAAAVFRY